MNFRACHLLPCTGLPVGVEERKKQASSEIANERKTPGSGKGRACKHRFKNIDPPTSWRNVSRIKMSNVKTSKGVLLEVFTCWTFCWTLRARSLMISVSVEVKCHNWPITGYTRSWYTGMRCWKQCLEAALLRFSPALTPITRSFSRSAFPTTLEPGTG